MKAQMQADIERMAKWQAAELARYTLDLDAQIRQAQHLKAAAMKAQRLQRKAGTLTQSGDEG